MSTKKTNAKSTGFTDTARYFELIIYPETHKLDPTKPTIDDLIVFFKSHYISYAISPLHDKDLKDDGTPKKDHYHCLIYFRGKRSRKKLAPVFNVELNQFSNVFDDIKALRYLTHIDDLDFKADYTDRNLYAISDDLVTKYNNAIKVDYSTVKLGKDDMDAFLWGDMIPWMYRESISTIEDCIYYAKEHCDPHVIQYNLSMIRAILQENSANHKEREVSHKEAQKALNQMLENARVKLMESQSKIDSMTVTINYLEDELIGERDENSLKILQNKVDDLKHQLDVERRLYDTLLEEHPELNEELPF